MAKLNPGLQAAAGRKAHKPVPKNWDQGGAMPAIQISVHSGGQGPGPLPQKHGRIPANANRLSHPGTTEDEGGKSAFDFEEFKKTAQSKNMKRVGVHKGNVNTNPLTPNQDTDPTQTLSAAAKRKLGK